MTTFDQSSGASLDENAVYLWIGKADRKETLAIVTRAILRGLPLVPDYVASRLTLILTIFRLSSTALFTLKYQRQFPKKPIWHACDIIEEITGTAVAPTAQAASSIGSVLFGKGDEPSRMAARAIGYLLSFDISKASSKARRDTLDAISRDIQALQFGLPMEQMILMPLWPYGVPKWFEKIWEDLSNELRKRGKHWQIWIDWYDRLLVVAATGSPSVRSWDEAFVDARSASRLPWDEGPKAINEKIASRLAAIASNKVSSPFASRPTSGKQTLDQRPSNYRFDWQENRIEATPVTEPPFDQILASSLAEEVLAKAEQALVGLTDNNADEMVRRSIERVAELIAKPVAEIPEGILLSRFNTLAAYARAYADPASERERNIRAILDDLAASVQDLVDCYSGVRAINANRIALGMQAEHAAQVEVELGRIAALARDNHAIASSARQALESGKDEIDDLTLKIQRETNLTIAANYIKVRGEAVAARLSDSVNFMSATLQQGAFELKGLSADTWREVRKQLPKAAARGVTNAAEEAVGQTVAALIKLPIIGLAYLIAGPLGALAVLVPRLGAHRRKAQQLHQKIENSVGALDHSIEIEDEFRAKLQRNLARNVVLSALEERVLRMKFGIGVVAACSDEEIGRQLSLSLASVQKIQKDAMRTLVDAGLLIEKIKR